MGASRRLLSIAVVALSACAPPAPPPPAIVEVPVTPPAPPPAPPSLYARLGGKEGISGIVDSFASNVLADSRVAKAFARTRKGRLDHFKALFADQLCELSGGGCSYAGRSMKEAHARMKISEAEFDAIVQDLSLALQEKQVTQDAQKELLDKLAAMHDDIVGAKKGEP